MDEMNSSLCVEHARRDLSIAHRWGIGRAIRERCETIGRGDNAIKALADGEFS